MVLSLRLVEYGNSYVVCLDCRLQLSIIIIHKDQIHSVLIIQVHLNGNVNEMAESSINYHSLFSNTDTLTKSLCSAEYSAAVPSFKFFWREKLFLSPLTPTPDQDCMNVNKQLCTEGHTVFAQQRKTRFVVKLQPGRLPRGALLSAWWFLSVSERVFQERYTSCPMRLHSH